MTLGRTSSGAIKVKTDGGLRAVGCACCGGLCGPISFVNEYGAFVESNAETSYEISKEQFDNFQLGGTISWSTSINISFGPFACGFSHSDSIIIPPKTCSFRADGYSATPTCINDSSYYGGSGGYGGGPIVPRYSSTEFSVIVFADQSKYYLYISGYTQCPVGNGTTICVPIYRNVGKNYSSGEGGSFSLLGATIGYDVDSTWSVGFSPNPPI